MKTMGKHLFDYEDGDFIFALSDSIAVDSDGNMMMRMGDSLAISLDHGLVQRPLVKVNYHKKYRNQNHGNPSDFRGFGTP